MVILRVSFRDADFAGVDRLFGFMKLVDRLANKEGNKADHRLRVNGQHDSEWSGKVHLPAIPRGGG